MVGTVRDVQSKLELDGFLKEGSLVIIHFWASLYEASNHMDQVFSHLSIDFPRTHFLRVEAEQQPEICDAYSVSLVPYFVFAKDGKIIDTLEGANPLALVNKVAKMAESIDPGEPASSTILESVKELSRDNKTEKIQKSSRSNKSDDLQKRLQELINSNPVMLFMKGNPENPQCGFSQKVIDILKDENVKFGTFDILTDKEVREGLKKFSDWPTFPQLYCKGELLGGCDIAIAMHQGGELKDFFKDRDIKVLGDSIGSGGGISEPSKGLSTTLTARIVGLINSSPVMLFMKGKPDAPKCGFSGKVADILEQEKVDFRSFDILEDNKVRKGLMVYSNWSSYPQLYINGKLIGGSDILIEMKKSGELDKVLTETGIVRVGTLEHRLRKLIKSSPVMLFMKGSPDEPRCGFSSKVVNALRKEELEFGSFDILSDEEVREGLKSFSNWPTFPQLYYEGELVGGCDIVLELHKNGELKSTLSE